MLMFMLMLMLMLMSQCEPGLSRTRCPVSRSSDFSRKHKFETICSPFKMSQILIRGSLLPMRVNLALVKVYCPINLLNEVKKAPIHWNDVRD